MVFHSEKFDRIFLEHFSCLFRALKNLSVILNDAQNVNSVDRRIQHKVDSHWSQIAAQINRLKVFKVN